MSQFFAALSAGLFGLLAWSLWLGVRTVRTHVRREAALTDQLARVRKQLQLLRDDIRREEQAVVDQRPVLFRWPERIDDVIAQETAMKRRLDGLGDE